MRLRAFQPGLGQFIENPLCLGEPFVCAHGYHVSDETDVKPVTAVSDKKIAVPSAFYKIIVDEDKGKPRVLGFVMDHGIASTSSFHQFLMNVKAIEALAGVDFFPSLPDDVKTKLEKAKPLRTWKLPRN